MDPSRSESEGALVSVVRSSSDSRIECSPAPPAELDGAMDRKGTASIPLCSQSLPSPSLLFGSWYMSTKDERLASTSSSPSEPSSGWRIVARDGDTPRLLRCSAWLVSGESVSLMMSPKRPSEARRAGVAAAAETARVDVVASAWSSPDAADNEDDDEDDEEGEIVEGGAGEGDANAVLWLRTMRSYRGPVAMWCMRPPRLVE